MSALYPGVAPLSVSISTSAGAPGVIVSTGIADPFGIWPTPTEMTGGDKRFAVYLMAAVESLTSRTNWLGWHSIDWARGGDYRTAFRPQVSIGNSLVIDRSWAADTTTAIIAEGPTGSGAYTMDIFGGGTSGHAARLTAGSSADFAVYIIGGSTTGAALHAAAQAGNSNAIVAIGSGSGSGIVASAGGTAGTPSVRAQSGPVLIDTDNASPTADPGAHMLWSTNVCAAWGTIKLTSNALSIVDGFNISATPTIVPGRLAVANTGIRVAFKRALADQGSGANGFSVILNHQPTGADPPLFAFIVGTSKAEFIFGLSLPGGDADFTDPATVDAVFYFQVFGRQS